MLVSENLVMRREREKASTQQQQQQKDEKKTTMKNEANRKSVGQRHGIISHVWLFDIPARNQYCCYFVMVSKLLFFSPFSRKLSIQNQCPIYMHERKRVNKCFQTYLAETNEDV